MRFAKLPEKTLSDYPGKIALELFTLGCNFRCGYCHNPELLKPSQRKVDEEKVLNFLESKLEDNWYDGVCVSGGEPTIHEDLLDFIRRLKGLGFFVKLDTNGTNPDMLKGLIDENLVDYFAMDIKTVLSEEDYQSVVERPVDIDDIARSAGLIRNSDVDYMFRTTVVPGIHDVETIKLIGKMLDRSKLYQIQNIHTENEMLSPIYKKLTKPFPKEVLEEFKKAAEPYFDEVKVRE